jgi:hypothetical protein
VSAAPAHLAGVGGPPHRGSGRAVAKVTELGGACA